jgi:prolyl oligopeptidase
MEISPNGSESAELMIMDVETREFFPEKIDRIWFASPSWLEDNESFFYNRLNSADVHDPDRLFDSKVYLHKVGNDPSKDKHIFSREKYPDLGITKVDIPIVIYDKDIQMIYGGLFTVDNRMNMFYAPASKMKKRKIPWERLFALEDDVRWVEPNQDHYFYMTAKEAPNFKIMKMPISDPDLTKAEVFVPESQASQIDDFSMTKEGLYYTTSTNGVESKLFYKAYDGGDAREIELPVTAGSLSLSTKGHLFDDVWIGLSGWTTDYKRYKYLPESDEFKVEQLSSVAEYPEYDNLVVEEVEVPSHDGVMVPLSIIYKKGTELNGKNPTLMMGYGSYGYPINPFFSPNFMLWNYHGGVLAVAHVRGGGEKGDAWHKGGFKTTKPNTWKDLIACAEYLIAENYTSADHLAINGGSAGGILVGRAMTDRPDLFAAVIPEVGSMNPLRSEVSPNGPINVPEFGTVEDSVECMALLEMDSYHAVEDGVKYPATLITAGMNDPRVIVWEPGKFAARLLAANASDEPVLFLVDYEAGHGIGDSKTKAFESLSDMFSFAFWQTGHKDFQP